jgi:hypothetical protein
MSLVEKVTTEVKELLNAIYALSRVPTVYTMDRFAESEDVIENHVLLFSLIAVPVDFLSIFIYLFSSPCSSAGQEFERSAFATR